MPASSRATNWNYVTPANASAAMPSNVEMRFRTKDGQLLDQLQNTNRENQSIQLENINKMYRSNQKGVKAEAVF